MDIIKPNSSYPSLHDGLHIYSGSTTSVENIILIKTVLRQTFYVRFYRSKDFEFEEGVPTSELKIEELGYIESTDSTSGGLNYTVKNKSNYTLHYLIIGSHEVRTSPHTEITTGSGTLNYAQTFELECIIPSDGVNDTDFIKLKNSFPNTITLSKPSTGTYLITTTGEPIEDGKCMFHVTLEDDGFSDNTYEIRAKVVDTNSFSIKCYKNPNDGTGDTGIVLSNLPLRAFLSFKQYY